MLRGVIFDFDGVIVDSHPAHKRAWQRFLEFVGTPVSEEDLEFVLGGRTREDILRHFLGELDANTIAEYGHRKEQMFRDEAGSIQTMHGLEGFLEELENAELGLGIASSGSRTRVGFLLDRLGLAKRFRVVVTADDVARGEPDPALFLTAAEKLKIGPVNLVAFDDAASGVTAATAAGMKCVGIGNDSSSSVLLDAGASCVVEDFRSISYYKLQTLFLSAAPAQKQ